MTNITAHAAEELEELEVLLSTTQGLCRSLGSSSRSLSRLDSRLCDAVSDMETRLL